MNQRIILIVSALICSRIIDAAHAAEMITLRYGQNAASAGSLSSLPLTVAERKGFFLREGINLVVVPISGGTDRIVAALDKGEIDAGKNATPYLIQAVLKGSDAVAIIAQTANPIYSVIGLSTPGDMITLSTVRLLAQKGVKISDYQAKAVVGTSARFECLKSGECAAVPMGQPEDFRAIQQGYPRLAFTYEAGADLIFNVDMTRRAWGEKNQKPLVRMVRGFAAAYEFMNDPKNRAEVTSIVKDSLKVSDEIARHLFAPYTEPDKNVLPKRGELDLKAFDRVLKLMGEVGAIPTPVAPPERFVDLRYLKAAGIQ